MKHRDSTIHALKNSKGKVFTIGDAFTFKGSSGKTLVNGRISNRKNRISGFEAHDKGWYILHLPQYSNGRIEKDPAKAWRMCDLENAILIK